LLTQTCFFQLNEDIEKECTFYELFNETKQTFFRQAFKRAADVLDATENIVRKNAPMACGAAVVGAIAVLVAPEALVVGCVTLVAFGTFVVGGALWKFVSQSNS
jgi:hypothetical protein